MPGEEERIQKIVEEERLRAITESLQKNNNRVFTPEESKKYMSIMEDINTCKRRQKELDRLHQEKRAAYQEQLKKENLIPLLAPMYFILTAFIVVDILCIIVFRHIFDQTPIPLPDHAAFFRLLQFGFGFQESLPSLVHA